MKYVMLIAALLFSIAAPASPATPLDIAFEKCLRANPYTNWLDREITIKQCKKEAAKAMAKKAMHFGSPMNA